MADPETVMASARAHLERTREDVHAVELQLAARARAGEQLSADLHALAARARPDLFTVADERRSP